MNNHVSYRSSIISLEKAREMIGQGYFALDTHCHSSFSFDVPDVPETSPEAMIKEQTRLGLKALITDHDTMNGYYYMKKKGLAGTTKTRKGLIPGVEIKIKPIKAKHVDIHEEVHSIHINVFGLNKDQLNVLETIAEKDKDLDAFVKYLRQQDLSYMYNHPFWHEPHERLNWKIIPGIAKHYFDVIELNSNRPKAFNDLALHMAEQFNKGIVASTDSHTGEPGKVFVMAEGKNFEEFWQNVLDRKMHIYRHDMTTWGVVKESAAMIHNIFKANTRAAKDRQFTSVTGIKPFDNIAMAVTTGRLKRMYFTKNIIHSFFYTLNYTAGPIIAWRLYMNKENSLADKIRNGVRFRTRQIKQNENQELYANKSKETDLNTA